MYLGLVLIVMIVSGTYILLSLRNIEIDKSRQELATYAERINEQVIEGGKCRRHTGQYSQYGWGDDCLHHCNGGTLSGLYGSGDYCGNERHDLLFHTEKKHRFLRASA